MSMPVFTDFTVPTAVNLNALGTGITNLSTYVLGAPPPRSYVPQVRVRLVAQQSITSVTYTVVNFAVADVDNDNMFSPSVPGQVTIRTAGTWALRAEWRWDTTSGGDRQMVACYNGNSIVTTGVGVAEQHYVRQFTDGPVLHISTLLPGCSVGAPVSLIVFQDSGSTAQNSNNVPNPYLEMWRIGP